jgi:hypothetical protein
MAVLEAAIHAEIRTMEEMSSTAWMAGSNARP